MKRDADLLSLFFGMICLFFMGTISSSCIGPVRLEKD